MMASHAPGSIILSVDRYAPPFGEKSSGRRPSGGDLSQLVDLIAELGFSATWSTGNPAGLPESETIARVAPEPEFAIAAERNWFRPEVSRAEFSKHLATRVSRAAAAGYSVVTMVLPDDTSLAYPDVAARHGIDVVRVSSEVRPGWKLTRSLAGLFRSSSGKQVYPTPHRLRHGVWQVPVSLRFPLVEHFSARGSARQAIREVGKRIAAGAWLNLAVDAQVVSQQGAKGIKATERLLSYLKQRQVVGDIQVCSTRTAVGQLTGRYSRSPAQSILTRRAA